MLSFLLGTAFASITKYAGVPYALVSKDVIYLSLLAIFFFLFFALKDFLNKISKVCKKILSLLSAISDGKSLSQTD